VRRVVELDDDIEDGDSCLLVDDDRLLVDFLSKVFAARGYAVLTATTGAEALRIFRQRRVSFVLLDVNMPDMDGFEVLRAIKRAGQARDVPVIMLSARTAASDVQKALSEGAADYIGKPISPSELAARISELLWAQA
jgi:DNA-binding response OmpR family regulator